MGRTKVWCRWRCGVGVESPGGRKLKLLCLIRCSQFFDLLAVSTLSLFTSSDRYLHRTSTHTRTGRIHLLYTYTWYLYLQYNKCIMWAPHTVCTFARCPLLSTDLLRIENKTLDQISISMKTPPCGNHHMYVYRFATFPFVYQEAYHGCSDNLHILIHGRLICKPIDAIQRANTALRLICQ